MENNENKYLKQNKFVIDKMNGCVNSKKQLFIQQFQKFIVENLESLRLGETVKISAEIYSKIESLDNKQWKEYRFDIQHWALLHCKIKLSIFRGEIQPEGLVISAFQSFINNYRILIQAVSLLFVFISVVMVLVSDNKIVNVTSFFVGPISFGLLLLSEGEKYTLFPKEYEKIRKWIK